MKKPKTMENNSSVNTVHENNENNESTIGEEDNGQHYEP